MELLQTTLEYGVLQGSLIGPPCFAVNVNDMVDCTKCNLNQFADDSTAHTVCPFVDQSLMDQCKLNPEILKQKLIDYSS